MILRLALAWTDPISFARWEAPINIAGRTVSVVMLLAAFYVFIRFRQ
ncbi:hypothetical protein HED60_12780 [Planctomycetales bacterium ZRK34]|nr:hypothetical protein HED60_12780 [Planctomycetales bacterium ZRK34]